MSVCIVGAGLAGCEAAWQLANRGIEVELWEMKPQKMSPAHHSDQFAELVCSNSLRSDRIQNAVGLLKAEMRALNSLIIQTADETRVPAGGALAVDRERFSSRITQRILSHPHIRVVHREMRGIPSSPAIIAAGPLASEAICDALGEFSGLKTLNFYDAAAPIVTAESLDMSKIVRASRYDRGDGEDYLNCGMTKDEYLRFVDELIHAETAQVHDFEENRVFEGCMPVESMAKRGPLALSFGPMKASGLKRHFDRDIFAVVQLRKEDAAESAYNLVGFQTRLKFPEQKRVFRMIPGLENAEFARFGVMHRNTFLNSPGFLNDHFEVIERRMLYFAGQITGVEGYVESAASGLSAGIHLAMQLKNRDMPSFTRRTAIGALGNYVAAANRNFQPMNITFSLMQGPDEQIRNKDQRTDMIARKSMEIVEEIRKATE